MNINEKIGDYTIIKHGEIIVYNNEVIQLELKEENSIFLKIKFAQIDGEKNSIKQSLEDNILTLQFTNYDAENTYYGMFEPVRVGKLDNQNALYLSIVVHTLNTKYGNRIVKYTFLKKD